MNANCFTRPKKPLTCSLAGLDFNIKTPLILKEKPRLLTVDSSTECHTTPDHIADLMVSYLDYQAPTIDRAGSSILEPSAGTGQLVNALIESGIEVWRICSIEKHAGLCDFLQDRFKDLKVNQGDFLTDFNEFKNEYDRVICNPPFKNINAHIDHVYNCLKSGGVAVCLVPITYKKIDHDVCEILDSNTFSFCKVNTKIIKIVKLIKGDK